MDNDHRANIAATAGDRSAEGVELWTPWTARRDDTGGETGLWSVIDANGAIVFFGLPEVVAHLIAAAPDLLEQLKIARTCIAYCRRAHKDAQSGEGIPAEIFIDAAIAKAEGREKEPML